MAEHPRRRAEAPPHARERYDPRQRPPLHRHVFLHLRLPQRASDNLRVLVASTDETVYIIPHPAPAAPTPGAKPIPPIQHPTAVRTILPLSLTPLAEPYLLTGSGEAIRVYDVSSPEEPELIAETDAHWHDVTTLRLWIRRSQVEGEPSKVRVEPWIVSASLDGTLRRWKLSGELFALAEPRNCCAESRRVTFP